MDLETVISNSVADARESGDLPDAVSDDGDTSTEVVEETPAETPVVEEKVVPEPVAAVVEGDKPVVPAKVEEKAEDEDLGPAQDKRGRENRIPYSRVQKITAKAETRGRDAAKAEYEPKIAEFTTKVSDYETRLNEVAGVEHIMFNDQPRFLQILQTIPGYAELLSGKVAPAQTPVDPASEKPKPDVDLGEGKWTYSPEGVEKLTAWTAAQAEKRLLDRFKPLQDQFDAEQHTRAMKPVIDAHLNEAAQWEGFLEHQDEILKALQADSAQAERTHTRPKLSMERAYLQVIVPKLKKAVEDGKADEAKLRTKILAELAKAPVSTGTAPIARKQVAADDGKPKDLESVIKASIKGIK